MLDVSRLAAQFERFAHVECRSSPLYRHLARFYPTLGGAYAEGDEASPHFRSFCLEHRQQGEALIARRAAPHLPPASAAGKPLVLVAVGASAGLLLQFDRYAYNYGGGRRRHRPERSRRTALA